MSEGNVHTSNLTFLFQTYTLYWVGTKPVLKDFEGKSNLLKKRFKHCLEDLFLLIEAKRQSFYFLPS